MKHIFDVQVIVEIDTDCEEDPGDVFCEAMGEMQNKLNDTFPGGLGNPHVEITQYEKGRKKKSSSTSAKNSAKVN